MKTGDKVPVLVAGQVVAQAEVRELDAVENTATLVVPGTIVVMQTRTDITTPEAKTPETETIITGVDRAGSSENSPSVEEVPNTGSESVGETSTGSSTESKVGETTESVSSTQDAASPVETVAPAQPATYTINVTSTADPATVQAAVEQALRSGNDT